MKKIISLVLLVCSVVCANAQLSRKQFDAVFSDQRLNQIWVEYKILPSLVISQSALESGWGKSSQGFNLFGLTDKPNWSGKTHERNTTEYSKSGTKTAKELGCISIITVTFIEEGEFKGQYRYDVVRKFKSFNSYDDCIREYCNHLRSGYRDIIGKTNYKVVVPFLNNYATRSNYVKTLINIIEREKLYEIDMRIIKLDDEDFSFF